MTLASRLTNLLLLLASLISLVVLPTVSADATFPGANGRIAFDDAFTGQIYAINPDGTGLVQLTHAGAGQFTSDPSWTSDGTRIAYDSNESGPVRLWIMDADGRHQHLVADDRPNAADWAPAYTPDGSRLVYFRCLGRACAIYSIGVDGTHRVALTPFVRPPFEVFDVDPSVSSDGRVAFTRFNQNVEGILSQVYVMDADGTHLHHVTPARLEAWFPDWSPAGTSIAFTSNRYRLGRNAYVMNADGTGIHKLTSARFPHNDSQVAFSPEGNRMVFISNRRYSDLCCRDLFVMKANGTHQTRIETGLMGPEDLAWGTAPPIASDSKTAFTVHAVSPSEAVARLAARCRMLPKPLRTGQPCVGDRVTWAR